MHETRLVRDLVARIEAVAAQESAPHVESVRIEIGALSHVTADSLTSQFELAAKGSVAQNAELDIVQSDDPSAPDAIDVRLVSIVVGDI